MNGTRHQAKYRGCPKVFKDGLTIEAQVAVDAITDVHPNARGGSSHRVQAAHRADCPRRRHPGVGDWLAGTKTNNLLLGLRTRRSGRARGTAEDQLHPGMPATVMIPTVQRTAFEYIAGPLIMSFNHSFRQR